MKKFSRKTNELLRILVILTLMFAVLFLAAKTLDIFYDQSTHTPDEIESYSASLLSIIQSLFFLTTGVVGVLSYLQAKETIFSPIKTEIFKLQIGALQEVLNFFFSSDTAGDNIEEFFDIYEIINFNTNHMLSEYSKIFFGDDNPVTKLVEKGEKESIRAIRPVTSNLIPPKFLKPTSQSNRKNKQSSNQKLLLEKWQRYEHDFVYITEKETISEAKIYKLAKSPFIPNELRALILDVMNTIDENIIIIGKVLTEVAKDLPNKYKTVNEVYEHINSRELYKVSVIKYFQKRNITDVKVKTVLDYINKYLRINQIIE